MNQINRLNLNEMARREEELLDLEAIFALQKVVGDMVSNNKKKLAENMDKFKKHQFEYEYEYDSYHDSIQEQYELELRIQETFNEMVIVCLYKMVEINRKNLFIKYIVKEEKINLSHINNIVDLDKEHNLKIECFNSYLDMEELRLVNNCIKHNDSIIEEKLNSKFKKYIIGESIAVNESMIDRFKVSAKEYIHELARIFHKRENDRK
ncbi:hypothetical protein C9J22_06690 [Photobacterium phosphoreum]|uniref:hypothetical protein n=1 Tax=Photobacterium phosphoreum TaxID=659 RepID=UPI000D167E56|nr:hypothetical protein [Photobacterium phosphoreum]PSU71470.1 hypothetical protein C9J22_06690 [Photobacterium phosphoreum]